MSDTLVAPAAAAAAAAPCPRPPNRVAHEKLVEDLCQQLSVKEDRRRFLQDRLRGLKDSLARVRTDRDSCTEQRNQVDETLLKVNTEVS